MSLSIILLVEDTFDDDEDDQNVATMRVMMMGIAVLQGRLLAAAGSENNSLHLLMSADHHFIINVSGLIIDTRLRNHRVARDPVLVRLEPKKCGSWFDQRSEKIDPNLSSFWQQKSEIHL